MVDHLYFVHGTGVREAGFRQTLSDLDKNLPKYGLGIPVSGRSWGVELGVRVSDAWIAGMIPREGAAKGLVPTEPEVEGALWAQLMDDPLFELRLMTLIGGAPIEVEPGAEPPATILKARLDALDVPAPVGGVTSAALHAAAVQLATEEGWSETLTLAASKAGQAGDPALVAAVARAVVALSLAQARGEPGAGPDALYLTDERAALVDQVALALSGEAKGLMPNWILDPLKKWAEAKATAYGARRRTGLMNAVSPGMGDIVYSQRRGDDVLAQLRKDIEAIPGQVAVLGHSLGGEHLMNLLLQSPPKNVVKLVTVASQVAYFTACDSMRDLRLPLEPGKRDPLDPPLRLPAGFPTWVNFFDRNDFLSFRAEPCFVGGGGVTDEEITSGVPFPDSHGAYFRAPDFYRRLVACLKK